MNKKRLLSSLLAFAIVLSILIPTIYSSAEAADALTAKETETSAETEPPALMKDGEGTPASEATASDSPAIEETPEPEPNSSVSPSASPVLDLTGDSTTIGLLPKIDDKLCYNTGEEVCFQANIHLSDEDAIASGTVLEIALPNKCLSGINAPEINEATLETDDKTTDGVTYIRYTFDMLASGITLSIPITIETGVEVTDSFALPINASVLSAKGNKLAVAEELALQFEPVAVEEGTDAALLGKGAEPLDAGADPLLLFTLAPTIEGKLEYLTGETAAMGVTIDMSSVTTTMYNVTVNITIPNEYMDKVEASDISAATKSIAVNNVAKETTITYLFSELTGGTSIQIPFSVKTKVGFTPDNYILNISAQMLDSLGGVLKSANPVNLAYQTIQPIFQKCVIIGGSGKTFSDNEIVFAGFADATNTNLVSMTDTVPVTFSYQFYNFGDVGYRIMNQHIIRDTLPEGAVFDTTLNPSWTYEESTRIATYVSPETPVNVVPAKLQLLFPGGTVLTQPYTNKMEAEFIPYGAQPYEDKFSAQDSITIFLSNELPGMLIRKNGPSSIPDQMTAKQRDIYWSIIYNNPSSDYEVENLVLEDHNLDTRLKLKSISFQTNGILGTQPDGGGLIDVEAVDSLGNVTIVASNVATSRGDYAKLDFDLPDGTVDFRIKFVGETTLMKSGELYITVIGRFIDPEGTHAPVDFGVGNLMYNTATATANYKGSSAEYTANSTSTTRFDPYAPIIMLDKINNPTSVFVNDITVTELAIHQMYGGILAPDVANLQSLIDLLPIGFEYVSGNTEFSTIANNGTVYLASLEPTVMENYKGTGRNALVWDFVKPFDRMDMKLHFNIRATRDATEGANLNEAYLIWDNNGSGDPAIQQIIPASRNGLNNADTMDIDNDGNTTELLCYASETIIYTPAKELFSTKSVKGDLDTAYLTTVGSTEIGGGAEYKLTVTNKGINEARTLTALDVLPRAGDKSISPDDTGTYVDRGSQFDVFLTGPITAPTGYTIYYNTSGQSGTPASYADGAGWTTSVADYAAVRGIKIVMNAGGVLATGAAVSFTFPVVTDDDTTITHDQVAVNSFAISVDGVNYLESTNRKLRILAYTVKGIAFVETDHDGIYEKTPTSEKLLPNVRVWLEDASGNPALDLNGNPIETITDANGSYTMTMYHSGVYRVAFDMPSAYGVATVKGADTNPNASHVVSGHNYTDTFTPSVTNPVTIRNSGLFSEPASIGNTVWNDADGDGVQDVGEVGIAGVTVTLLDSAGNTVATTTTDANGEYLFENLLLGNYTVKVTAPAGMTETYEHDGSLNGSVPVTLAADEVNINTNFGYTVAGASIGNRVWNDADGDGVQDVGEAGLAGVTVTLLDNVGNTVATKTTNANGDYLFENLLPGNYTVTVATPTGMAETYEQDGSLNGSVLVTLTTNEINTTTNFGFIAANASIGNRVWNDADGDGVQDAGEVGIAGVTVRLLDSSGNTVATTTTNVIGEYLFENLRPGSYTITAATPAGMSETYEKDGSLNGSVPVTLTASEINMDMDFGLIAANASIGNRVWNDADGDGVQDAGETGITGVTLRLLDSAGNIVSTKTTDTNGEYLFDNLLAGGYTVTVATPTGMTESYEQDGSLNGSVPVTLTAGEKNSTTDFGFIAAASVGNRVWNDADGDGVQDDPGEVGIAGVTVRLLDSSGNTVATKTTDANGEYLFDNLIPGNYTVTVATPTAMAETYEQDGSLNGSVSIALSVGEKNTSTNFGFAAAAASIGNRIWNDADGDGVQDAGEVGIAGVTVRLLDSAGNIVATKTTDANGEYVFNVLLPGSYTVSVTPPSGMMRTYEKDGSLNGSVSITFTSGDIVMDIDFGFTEDADGTLTLAKVLKDAAGNSIVAGRNFTVRVTGPSYPAGRDFAITNTTPTVLENLAYGEYVVEELNASAYTTVVSGKVALSVSSRTGTITITNTERAVGELTVSKTLLNADGIRITTSKKFVVRVTGPSYPAGQLFEVTNTTPLVLRNLIVGQYQAEEVNASSYNVTITAPVSLSVIAPSGSIMVTNREKGKDLPVTGEETTGVVIIGVALITIGVLLITLSKKKKTVVR